MKDFPADIRRNHIRMGVMLRDHEASLRREFQNPASSHYQNPIFQTMLRDVQRNAGQYEDMVYEPEVFASFDN